MDTLTLVLMALAIALLGAIAVAMLSTDVLRGAIGGRRTLERAQRLLIVFSDAATRDRGESWVRAHRESHPDVECIPIDGSGRKDFDVYLAVQEAIDLHRAEAVVWVLRGEGGHHPEEGPYAMAKRELSIPIDAIFTTQASPEVTST